MNIAEKASYIKGLADGLELDKNSKEGKVIDKLLDLVTEMAERIEMLEQDTEEIFDYMEEMAEDLVSMEDDLYSDDFEDYSDLNDDEDFDAEEELDGYYEIECPSCGEKVCFTEDVELESFLCPACGEDITNVVLCEGECDDCEECEN